MDSLPTNTARLTQGCLIGGMVLGMLVLGAVLAIASADPFALASFLAVSPFLAWGGWHVLNRITAHWMLRPYRQLARALAGAQVTVSAVASGPPDSSRLFEDTEALRDEYHGSLRPRLVEGKPRTSTFEGWLQREKQRQQEHDARLAWYILEVSIAPVPSQGESAWSPHQLLLVSPDAVLTGRPALFGAFESWELEELSLRNPGTEEFCAPDDVDVCGTQRLRCAVGIPPGRRTLRLTYATVLPLADVEFPPHDVQAAPVPEDRDATPAKSEAVADAAAERSPLQFNMFSMLLMMTLPGLVAFLLRLAGLDGVQLAMTTLLCSLAAMLCIIFYRALA